jgi:hypothetical protein
MVPNQDEEEKKEKERKNEMLETRNMSYEYMSGTIRKISQGKIQ